LKKVAVILGTRPEIIKLSPVIRRLEAEKADYFILHTGQHYSYQLDKVFFEQLKLPVPKNNLNVGSGSHAEETGKMLIGIEKVLQEEKPHTVLVEGDTNSVLAGALAASKLGIKIGHVEAGLRSGDRTMPEEINRIVADHISDFLFTPTEKSKQILLHEGIGKEKIFVTGNTVVDAVYQNLDLVKDNAGIFESLKLTPKKYFLVTLHRQENVDNPDRFASILAGLKALSLKYKFPVIYPIHPRSLKKISAFGRKAEGITVIDPVDYLAFLLLESNARLILTDSGGIQEEACILNVPCVTLRDNTERPETVDVGANVLAGASPERIAECARVMMDRKEKWKNPFGDGRAAEKILDIIRKA
jgi:UDP-N-acetylglucosamine 2-epimerase (non-hydrolysing)